MSPRAINRRFADALHRLRRSPHDSDAAGFTLLELLVVIGLIVVLLGGVGIALNDRSGAALASAQQNLAALCGVARAQAALHQTEARLLVAADRSASPDMETYLRLLQVFRAEPAGSDTWVAVGAAVVLPRGIYVVPPDVDGLVAAGIEWPTHPPAISTLAPAPAPPQPTGAPFADVATVFMLEFKPEGTPTLLSGLSSARLAVGAAQPGSGLPQFDRPAAVRGVLIRANGALSFINEAAAF